MVKARAFSCLLAWAACTQEEKPLTQLILVADTDMSELDSIEFVVSSEVAPEKRAQATRAPGDGPSYVALVREQGALGPLTVSARGRANGDELIARVHRVSFVPDETYVVALHLFASCRNVRCEPDQTCDESGCVSRELAESQLSAWSGEAPRIGGSVDGGAEDAGADAQAADGQAADSQVRDGQMSMYRWCEDSGWVDLQSNQDNCGSCDHRCENREDCEAGACVRK